MKIELSKQEITILVTMLSQVQVQLDNAEQLLVLRKKLQDSVSS